MADFFPSPLYSHLRPRSGDEHDQSCRGAAGLWRELVLTCLAPTPAVRERGGKGDKGDKEKPRRDRNKDKSTASSTVEICKNWNSSTGSCAGDGPCTHGRKHICDVCGGNHRRIDKHGKRQSNQSKGNDKKKQRND